ncbi:hypothetical protein LMH73_017880 [Vibrio splendidus]|nr:hypothetical protein [Vibrio splendidus]MCC4883311.1 hypothetical protein [Vibrio splendidus]
MNTLNLNIINTIENRYKLTTFTIYGCSTICAATMGYSLLTSSLLSKMTMLPTPQALIIGATLITAITQLKKRKQEVDSFNLTIEPHESDFIKSIHYNTFSKELNTLRKRKVMGVNSILKKFKIDSCYLNKHLTIFQRARLIACYQHMVRIQMIK